MIMQYKKAHDDSLEVTSGYRYQGMQSRDICVQREQAPALRYCLQEPVKSCAWQAIYNFLLNLVSSDEYF